MGKFTKFKGSNKYKDSKKEFMSYEPQQDSGQPSPEKIDGFTSTITSKAFRDLQFGGTIATKADPNTTASTASSPYAVIARTNKLLDGVYPGTDNLNGNVVVQMMNSNTTKLLNNYDSGVIQLAINYLYLNLNDKDSKAKKSKKGVSVRAASWGASGMPVAINKYMGEAINEALSRVQSEMLTQLPFSKYYVQTNVGNMDNNNHGLVLALYQTVLQNIAASLAKYYQTMSVEKELTDMGYNREAYYTIELMGLLKKKAFVQKLNALSSFVIGEYFDTDWQKQVGTLINIPSRKEKSVRSPLITCVSYHVMPNITVYNDSSNTKVELFKTSDYNVTIDGTSKWLDEAFLKLNKLLDANSILTWARKNYTGKEKVTAIAYFNKIVDVINGITTSLSTFNNDMADLRTFLDLANKIGINYWTKGYKFNVSMVPQVETSYNKILHDVISNYLATPSTVTWDSKVMRWTFSTFWDEFTGIPTYDRKSGGAFLTFSTKSKIMIDEKDVAASGLTDTDSILLIPYLFTVLENSVEFTNRKGDLVELSSQTYSTAEINEDTILSRLLPVSGQKGDIRIPQINVSKTAASEVKQQASAGYELIQEVFGIGQVKYDDTNQVNIALSPSVVSLIDIQIEDVSNSMISFCRAYSPFRVWVPNGSRTIGFGVK